MVGASFLKPCINMEGGGEVRKSGQTRAPDTAHYLDTTRQVVEIFSQRYFV